MSEFNADPNLEKRKKIAGECWKKGTESMSRENWDYAIEMFSQAAQLVPENLAYRQSLRGVQYRKYKNNKSGAKLSFLTMNSIRGKVKKARAAKNWNELDKAAEEGLALNPWEGQRNADLGEACRQRTYDEVAIFAYEKAVEAEPENRDFIIGLADMRERRRDYNGAITCWERIQRLEPLNGGARQKISALRAESVIDRGGYEAAETTKTVRLGYEESVSGTTKEVDGPGMSQEADIQRAIRKEPTNRDNFMKLADLYRRESRLDEAVATYQKVLEMHNDPNVREQLEDIEMEILKKALIAARDSAPANDADEAHAKKVALLQSDLIKKEIDVFARRIERYPADLKLKFELAQRYFRVKRYQQAIPLYQQAAKDQRLENTVLLNLGKCFLAEKKNDLAKRQFQKATEILNFNDYPDQFKECFYLLARLYEEAKDPRKAEELYTEVLAVDYAYRDVQKRLEALQSGS